MLCQFYSGTVFLYICVYATVLFIEEEEEEEEVSMFGHLPSQRGGQQLVEHLIALAAALPPSNLVVLCRGIAVSLNVQKTFELRKLNKRMLSDPQPSQFESHNVHAALFIISDFHFAEKP